MEERELGTGACARAPTPAGTQARGEGLAGRWARETICHKIEGHDLPKKKKKREA